MRFIEFNLLLKKTISCKNTEIKNFFMTTSSANVSDPPLVAIATNLEPVGRAIRQKAAI